MASELFVRGFAGGEYLGGFRLADGKDLRITGRRIAGKTVLAHGVSFVVLVKALHLAFLAAGKVAQFAHSSSLIRLFPYQS